MEHLSELLRLGWRMQIVPVVINGLTPLQATIVFSRQRSDLEQALDGDDALPIIWHINLYNVTVEFPTVIAQMHRLVFPIPGDGTPTGTPTSPA